MGWHLPLIKLRDGWVASTLIDREQIMGGAGGGGLF